MNAIPYEVGNVPALLIRGSDYRVHFGNGGSNYNSHFGDKSIWKDVIPYEVIEVPISDLSVVPAIHNSS